jgi:hypothetical protein
MWSGSAGGFPPGRCIMAPKNKPDSMEAFRLAKKINRRKILPNAECKALIAIADACSMREEVCRKSIATLASEYGTAEREIRYGLHGRRRRNGSMNYAGLIAKGIVLVEQGGRREDGVPTVYRLDVNLMRALADGEETSAQTLAHTSAQPAEEPLHNSGGTSAHTSAPVQPSSLSSKSNSTTPTPGGAGVEKSPAQSQQLPQKSTTCESEALTEQSMIDALQDAYFAKIDEQIKYDVYTRYPEEIGVPRALNTTGSRELFDTLVQKFGVTRAELDVVAEAFSDWFDSTYLPGFKDKWEAEQRNFEARQENRSEEREPQPIKCPLVIFRKNMKVHIDAVRKWHREKAEEQSSASA